MYAKLQRAKVFELSLIIPDVKVIVVGSGDSHFYDALRERLEEGIDMADPDILSVREKIEEVIVGYCNKIWPLYAAQKDRPSAHMLIGIRAPDGFALLHTEGPMIKRSNNPECIGFGADFSMYHLKKLFRDTMPLSEVWPIAVYVLDLAKENVEFCGGDSHVFVIPRDGDVRRIEESLISETVEKFKRFASDTDKLIARAASLQFQESEHFRTFSRLYDLVPDLIEVWPQVEAGIIHVQSIIDSADINRIPKAEWREFLQDSEAVKKFNQELQELKDAMGALKRFSEKAQKLGIELPDGLRITRSS